MCRAAVSQFASDINTLFQDSSRGDLENKNDNGVTYTSILLNNAIDSFNDGALISNAQNLINSQRVGPYQFVGYDGTLDRVTQVSGFDRERELFGFNYFRLGTQSTSPFPSTSDQRRIVILDGNTRQILFNFTPTGSSSQVRQQVTQMRQTMIDAINSVELATVDAFALWAEEQSLPQALRGEMDDPDFDGLKNLFEYAYGTNPNGPNAPEELPRIVQGEDGLRFSVQRNTTADIQAFSYGLSTNLSTWIPFVPEQSAITRTPLGDNERILIDLPPGPRQFIQVTVARE